MPLKCFQLSKEKAQWALKWIESDSFAERLIALQLVEGIFLRFVLFDLLVEKTWINARINRFQTN